MPQTAHPSLEFNAEPIGRLIQLYRDRSEELRFPDVDAEVLGQMIEELEARRKDVDAAQVALGEAREALALLEQEMSTKARKAHAYATVFAVGDEQFESELSQIKLTSSSRPVRKRRPQPKKKGAHTSVDDSPLKSSDQNLATEIAAE